MNTPKDALKVGRNVCFEVFISMSGKVEYRLRTGHLQKFFGPTGPFYIFPVQFRMDEVKDG